MSFTYQITGVKRRIIPAYARHEIFKRDNYRCLECGVTNEQRELQIDHIIPISRGGSDELSNLQTLCTVCNLLKSDRFWEAGSLKIVVMESAFRCFMDKFSQNYSNNSVVSRTIIKCPKGHEVVTSKTKGVQCYKCYQEGTYKRFDLKK